MTTQLALQVESVPCNLCGGTRTEALFSQKEDSADATSAHTVVRCLDCGLQYVHPRPTPPEIGRFYTPDFVSYQFILDHPGASIREKLVGAITRSSARQRVRFTTRSAKLGRASRVLDLGCGKGTYLYALRDACGCDVTGLDFDAEAVRYCREALGIRTLQGSIAELDGVVPGFDVITLWHFLEHEFDPLSALRTAHRLLAHDGRLIVEVPNAESAENAVFGQRSYLYDLPRHLYHFTPATLKALLEKAGFEVEGLAFTCLAGGWVGSLQGLLTGGRVYRRLKDNVGLFLLLAQLAMPLDWLSATMGRGSIMTVVARKRSGQE